MASTGHAPRLALWALLATLGLGQGLGAGAGAAATQVQVPIVLWHGMGDSCYNGGMQRFGQRLEQHLGNGAHVKVLCFGSSWATDTASGFLKDANKQVQMACDAIAEDEKLRDGFHAIGLSQGGQFLRAVAQRCPSPPMKALVTLGGQHQGVYGLPHCTGAWTITSWACDLVRKTLSVGAYWGWVQRSLVQAQYWHDAKRPDRYRSGSTFLADINNDLADASLRNASYAENLANLERLVLVRFNQDSMVVPVASQWFEFYEPGSTNKILALEDSAIYKEDWIGLKKLAESGRLVRLAVDGDHLEFSYSWLFSEVVDKYLKTSA